MCIRDRSQDTRDGVMQYGGELQESKVDEGLTAEELARYAKMNGTLYFRAESNAGLQTQNEDIDKNCSRIRIWQQQLSAANVASDIAPDPSTGWYNTVSYTHLDSNKAWYRAVRRSDYRKNNRSNDRGNDRGNHESNRRNNNRTDHRECDRSIYRGNYNSNH